MDQVKHIFRLFTAFEFLDIVDIALLTIVFFSIYQFIKERRAGKLALGVGLLFVFLIVCVRLDLSAMKFLLENLFQSGIIVLAIIFQPELRSALEKMGDTLLYGAYTWRVRCTGAGRTENSGRNEGGAFRRI